MKKTSRKALLLSVLAISTAACSPVINQRGNLLESHQLEKVEAGVSTESDVLRILGSPTTKAPFDENIWYYIGQETEKRGILDAEVKNERIVIVAFAEDGTVAAIREADQGRIDVPVTRDRTPTYGNDLSAIQQILGNLGRFNPQDTQ